MIFGAKVLEKLVSTYNGKIQVNKTYRGTNIDVEGFTQSGWVVKKVWNSAFKKIVKIKPEVGTVLILGLGGGSAMELVADYWPDAAKVGVEIDQLLVTMGRRYLKLKEIINLDVVIEDAFSWLERTKDSTKFDLVLVDMYIGGIIPPDVTAELFMRDIKKLLKKDGVAVFNYLNFNRKKEDIKNFEKNLNCVFPKKNIVKSRTNVIFICAA